MRKEGISNIEINGLHGYKRRDVDFLKKYDFIEGVSIVDRDIDISAINALTGLRRIILTWAYNQVLQFSNFKHLEECSLTWSNNVKSVLSCETLKYLRISKFKFKDFCVLSKLRNLEWLEIVQSSLASLRGIENLQSLNNLELNYINNLENLQGIEEMRGSLCYLMINKCNKIKDYSSICSLVKLKKLVIIDSANIDSLACLNNLHDLKHLHLNVDVLDGDMTPCLGIEKVFFVNKKHFSHTLKQIMQLNEK
jgi:hypothetical protein